MYVVWILYKVVQKNFGAPRIYRSGIEDFVGFGYPPLSPQKIQLFPTNIVGLVVGLAGCKAVYSEANYVSYVI